MKTIKVTKREIMIVMITILDAAQHYVDEMKTIFEHEDIHPAFYEDGNGESYDSLLRTIDSNLNSLEKMLREECQNEVDAQL